MALMNRIEPEMDPFAYRYDTQLLIDKRTNPLDEGAIRAWIMGSLNGNELVVAGDEETLKVHYHTNEPWKLLEYCAGIGEIYDIVVEDMIRQAKGLDG